VEVVDHSKHDLAPVRAVVAAGVADAALVARPGVKLVVRIADADGNWPANGVRLAKVRAETEGAAWDFESVTSDVVEFTVAAGVPQTVHVECEGYEPAEAKGVVAGEAPVRLVFRGNR
jgi:hypothetical protein